MPETLTTFIKHQLKGCTNVVIDKDGTLAVATLQTLDGDKVDMISFPAYLAEGMFKVRKLTEAHWRHELAVRGVAFGQGWTEADLAQARAELIAAQVTVAALAAPDSVTSALSSTRSCRR